MSNGGAASQGVDKEPRPKRKSTGHDEFALALARISVAQICEGLGFSAFQQSALEYLSEFATRYVYNIGATAHSFANLAGRTESNVFDVVQGLEDLCLAQGFAGASAIDRCVASSGIVTDILRYVGNAEEIPFAYSVPRFPITKEQKLTTSFLQTEEDPPEPHIPGWLPAFPVAQDHLQMDTVNEGPTHCVGTVEPALHHKQIEQWPLPNLHQKFAWNAFEEPSSSDPPTNSDKIKQLTENNPFLAAPLQHGEKNVSHVTSPAKLPNEPPMKCIATEDSVGGNHVSVLEIFAPAIEAMKSSLSNLEVLPENPLSNERPAVKFNIKVGRKLAVRRLDLFPHSLNADEAAPMSGKDNTNNEKKQRAERILKESMENSELSQL